MSDDTRNGTAQVHAPLAGDAAQILAAVKELLPPAAAAELASWSRGERSATATVERLRELSRGDAPPAPEWKPGPSIRELNQQLHELAEQSPPFDEAAQRADCAWIGARLQANELQAYRGTHIAVLNGQVIGSGENSLQVQLDLARKLGVNPDQITIVYIFPAGFSWGLR